MFAAYPSFEELYAMIDLSEQGRYVVADNDDEEIVEAPDEGHRSVHKLAPQHRPHVNRKFLENMLQMHCSEIIEVTSNLPLAESALSQSLI